MSRVVGRVRLSRLSEESTSVERQREAITKWAEMHDHEIVGWATDAPLSGSVSPFDAPELAPWLNERLNEWDILVAYRLDRIARRVIPLNKLFGLVLDTGKSLVSVSESIDLGNWVGRLVAGVIAGVAEGELEAIQERTKNAFEHNITSGKYRGGNPPFGYHPVKIESACWSCEQEEIPCSHIGQWRYEPDPVMAPLARKIVARVLDGERVSTICRELNDAGTPTPIDHFLISQDKEPKGYTWKTGNLSRELRQETLLGYAMRSEPLTDDNGQAIKKNGRTQYGPKQVIYKEGKPLIRAEPIISPRDFQRLQKELDARKTNGSSPEPSNSLMLRVIYCGVCGLPMYHFKGRTAKYYRCSGQIYKKPCGNKSARVETADSLLTESLLSLVGHKEHKIPVYDPGEDATQELADIDAKLGSLAASVTRFPPGPALDALLTEVDALTTRRNELAAKPYRPAGYILQPTGKLFRDHWKELNQKDRNSFLRDSKVRVTLTNTDGVPNFGLDFTHLDRLLSKIDPGLSVEEFLQETSAE